MTQEIVPDPPEAEHISARGWTKLAFWLVLGTLFSYWLVTSGIFAQFDHALDVYLTQDEEEQLDEGKNPLVVMNGSGLAVLFAWSFFFIVAYAIAAAVVQVGVNLVWRKKTVKPKRDIIRI